MYVHIKYMKRKCEVERWNLTNEYIVVFLRGDLDVNETKLTNYLGSEIHSAIITEECGLKAGYIGPYKLEGNYTVLYDNSLQYVQNLSCGANMVDYHYVGLHIERDYGVVEYLNLSKIKDGGICPICGKPTISISRGIEVGNIFQLGNKYTKAMNMQYVDKDGDYRYPVMGCYGMGVGRLVASVCEARHDEYGPIWPITIAPWQVHLCCIRADDLEARACADTLYENMQGEKIEVIYDERDVRAGVMFSDADLLGVPIRVIVSPRNVQDACAEIVTRDKKVNMKVKISEVIITVKELIIKMANEV